MTSLSLLLPLLLAPVGWSFDQPGDLHAAYHVRPAKVAHGVLSGSTEWDPYVYLSLPAEGLDVTLHTRLVVRLYSSAPADSLAVYYATADGRWGLGDTFPVVAGWAEYRVNLGRLTFRERSPQDGSNQWGGVSKRITSLRLDPGNQADRFVVLDSVRLEEPDRRPFEAGVTPEPVGAGRLLAVDFPPRVEAGKAIPIAVSAQLTRAAGPGAMAAIWLTGSGGQIAAMDLQPLPTREGEVRWSVTLPTRRYDPSTRYQLRAGILGVKLTGAGFETVLGETAVNNSLTGTARPPKVTVEPLGGAPAMLVDGQPVAPFMVSINGPHQVEQQAEMGRAGIHIFSDWFGGSTAADLGHVAPDKYDYTAYDTYFSAALEADPEAWFLPHIGITPPLWWQQAHPEELVLYADGQQGPQSFASERWRRETADDLRKLIAHLQAAPYAGRILGYCFFSGYSAEWQSWGLWQNHLADYSPPARRAWSKWLTQRYGNDEGLRQAWGRAEVNLAEPPMPTPEQRHRGALGALRDERTERLTIDYYQFLAELTAEAINYFAKVTKEASAGRSLVGTYYGYLTAHSLRQQDSSHLALGRVLESPDIDFLMSPPLYTSRDVGGTSGFMSVTESVHLHGKLWLSEADHRTHLSSPDSGYGRAATAAGSQAVLQREMGHVLTHRAAVSWYDMVGGWLTGEELVPLLGRLRELHAESLAGRRPFSGEVAVVVDEASFTYVTAMHPLNLQLSLLPAANLPRAGLTWDFYLLDDLARADLPPHRVYLFLNAFRLSDAQRAMLHARLARERATAIWCYAPGYYGDGASGLAAMEQVTGFKLAETSTNGPLQVTGPAGEIMAGGTAVISPAFAVADPAAEPLGKLGQQVGLARKRCGEWTSIFCSAPNLAPATLRELARAAGCHVWIETGDALAADHRYACLHAATAGSKTLRLPFEAAVRDAVTGQPLLQRGHEIILEMSQGETRLLRLEPTE
ncbi:MAG: beta-galactosidase [Armatimonadetes bacterium]|nr:beta-galactosidase [Armatimonadota bacterium]